MSNINIEKLVVSPGEIIMISNGEYSDYEVIGVYRVLEVFDDKLMRYVVNNCKSVSTYLDRELVSYDYDKIVEKLIEEGYIEKVDTRELYLGAYSRADVFFIRE